jgi:hypothetical protein
MISNHGTLVPRDARQGCQHSILADPKRCAVLPRRGPGAGPAASAAAPLTPAAPAELKLPPNRTDRTAERTGAITVIVGAVAAPMIGPGPAPPASPIRFSGQRAIQPGAVGAASDLGAVGPLATGGSISSRDCHGNDQMKRIFFAIISVFGAAWVCTTGISVARLHLSLHDGADDLNGEARSPWSTR